MNIKERLDYSCALFDAEGGLAENLYTSGDYGAARNIYEDMLKTAKEVGDQKNVALALSAIGLIFFEQADLPNARKRFDESLKVSQRAGMKANYAWTLLAVGDLNLAQGQFDAAAKNYNDALQANKDLADALGVARSTAALALLALEQGRLAESQNLARQSADALHQQNNADFETDALATLALALVEDHKISEARAAIDRSKALPAQDQGIRSRLAISEAYVLAKEGKLPDELRSITETIQKAIDLKLKRLELEARLAKAKVDLETNSNPAGKAAAKQIAAMRVGAGQNPADQPVPSRATSANSVQALEPPRRSTLPPASAVSEGPLSHKLLCRPRNKSNRRSRCCYPPDPYRASTGCRRLESKAVTVE